MKIYALKYGESVLPESMIFMGGDEKKTRPVSFTFYLIWTESRYILVDAGCETMPGLKMKYFCSPLEILERLGVEKEEIHDVIITHAHHDHIEGVKHFKDALIHIQEDEYEAGKQYIPFGFRVHTFKDTCTVGGNVTVVRVGGHTKGSCIVKLDKDGKEYVIVGDECYIRECVEKEIPTGVSFCQSKSKEWIEEYAHSRLLFCHDYEILPGQNGYMEI